MMMSAGTVLQRGGKLDTVQKWSDTFDKCFDKTYDGYNRPILKRLRDLAVRLAKSDPYIMFDKSCWSQGMLLKVDDPCAWMAAYQRFGEAWKDRETFSPTFKSKDSPEPADPKDINVMDVEEERNHDKSEDSDPQSAGKTAPEVDPSSPPQKPNVRTYLCISSSLNTN